MLQLIAYTPAKINKNHQNTRFHRALLSTHWKGAKTHPEKLAHSEKNIQEKKWGIVGNFISL
jgi:hypothetical protein